VKDKEKIMLIIKNIKEKKKRKWMWRKNELYRKGKIIPYTITNIPMEGIHMGI
jgi:hypothetical protein